MAKYDRQNLDKPAYERGFRSDSRDQLPIFVTLGGLIRVPELDRRIDIGMKALMNRAVAGRRFEP